MILAPAVFCMDYIAFCDQKAVKYTLETPVWIAFSIMRGVRVTRSGDKTGLVLDPIVFLLAFSSAHAHLF